MDGLAGRYVVVGLPGAIPHAISAVTHSWANHAGIMIDDEHLIEAWVPRIHVRPLSDFDGLRVQFSEMPTAEQRRAVVAYAKGALGKFYDLAHFGALTLRYLFGLDVLGNLQLHDDRAICSRLVAQAGEAAGLDWTDGLPLSEVTPAVLARRLDITAAAA